ncbi:class I SAM-dependent methyltransferase [Aeromicrobium sp.]|uniref:class I SAM-dependent methyltransferase n=1 Tax=Aeromicrobium sp. TaxID=1871063 RepID=UPI0019BC06D4|nr:class I SAM-dependent methyltransferase [Aeromicrobium sp.]MBC7629903.1 class I SAM-dependent methyltransferase [Aeromicrobium sp.]
MSQDVTAIGGTETIDFGGLAIEFDDTILRPRAWTAEQSAWAVEVLADGPPGPVLELCTGAGHIGLLSVLGNGRHLVAVDANPDACAYARKNAVAAGLAAQVDVRVGLVEGALRPDERFAAVIADPPWVPHDRVGVYPEDPLLAIDGGLDGLDIARSCVEVAGQHLADGASLILQLGATVQAESIREWLASHHALGMSVVAVRVHPGQGVLLRIVRTAAA